MRRGCDSCHSIGKPNADGSIGTCTQCHSRHDASVALAREPRTCGQCHMGPDHSQIEIYDESKHGVLFNAERASINLDAPPDRLTTADMPVPTCATCHMSGLEGMGVTHDTTERLSWYLFEAVSKKRPDYLRGQDQMKEVCEKCHAQSGVDRYFKHAETVVADHQREGEERAGRRGRAAQGRLAHAEALRRADRVPGVRSVALLRAHGEARRVHGRRGLRAVARQLRAAAPQGRHRPGGERDPRAGQEKRAEAAAAGKPGQNAAP